MDARRQLTDLKIDISKVADILNGVAAFTPNEFSGVGFGKWSADKKTFVIYRVEILDIGTWGFTEIRPEDLKWAITDPNLPDMKCWFHRHPIGCAVPGPANWSSTDHDSCRNYPMGSAFTPTKGWSTAIVLTPTGWTGRIDEYGPGKGTHYVDVTPNFVADWFPVLRILEERAKTRYGRSFSEIGSGQRTTVPFDDDDEYEQDDLFFNDPEEVGQTYKNEDDDGPMHMWVQTFIENRNL